MILHFVDANAIGGIETHIETTVRALNAAGHPAAVMLWRAYPGSPFASRLKAAGLMVHDAGGSLKELARIMTWLRPSILHTHGYKANLIGRFAALFKGVACVSSFHAGERGPFPVNFYQAADEAMARFSARIAVSAEIAARLPQPVALPGNFVVMPCAPVSSHDRANLVFAGRLSHEKGPDLFCALASLRPDAGRWHMHGDGPMRGEIRVPGHVTLHGFTPDMQPVLAEAGLLVMTSRSEGLPMIALEAMAAGVPVLAPRLGGLAGLITGGKDGFLYAPGDMADAAGRLDEFSRLTRDERRALGHAARSRIETRYSARAVLPRLLAVYESALRPISMKVQSSPGR